MPLRAFAGHLRQLRDDAGGLSVRELATLTGFPRSTINDKLAGVSKPSWEFVEAFVRACGRAGRTDVDLPLWRARHRRLLHELRMRRDGDRQSLAANHELADRPPRLEPVALDAARMLTDVLGGGGVLGGHADVAPLAERCARLTLAMGVRFVSDLATVRPTMTIAELTAALAAEESWLSESAAWNTRM